MDSLSRLEEIGFQPVGCWKLVAGMPIVALDATASECNVLYAFVSGREVLYVGKTVLTLAKRMYGYQRPGPTQATNIACNARISQLLSTKESLDVFARRDDGVLRIGSFTLNQAAALEDAIIRELQPRWNTMGK